MRTRVDVLDQIVEEARASNSDELLVTQAGHIVREVRGPEYGTPIPIMSVTKFVVGLAFGRLLRDGHLTSLDTPIADIYPEWRQGRKRTVTVRMLLNHTSGIQNVASDGIEIEPASDWIQLALASELSHDPGTRFAYNNKAVLLIAGIVQRLTGKRLDVFMMETFFGPLGIANLDWFRDQTGTPYVAGGLRLRAIDLMKIGQLIVANGKWDGLQIVDAAWIAEMSRAGQSLYPAFGLLSRRLVDDVTGATLGIWHDGSLGQYLFVLPESEVVVVRLIDRDRYRQDSDGFAALKDLVLELA